MGKKNEDDMAENIEDALGLDSADSQSKEDDNTSDAGTGEDGSVVEKENQDDKDNNDTSKKEENNNITVTPEQIEINKAITKVDLEIEAMEKDNDVDVDKFYDTLYEILTDEEQQLEHDDKSAYMKLVSKKEKEYIKDNSKDEQIKELKTKKEELSGTYQRQEAIVEVSAKYPDYNHEAIINFFQNKLTKDEQSEIHQDATSYADIYERTYKKFIEVNPANIQSEETPNIPKVNDSRKQSVENKDIGTNLQSDEEAFEDALGLK